MSKYISTDIDGCLSEYPLHFLNWVKNETGVSYPTLESLKTSRSKKDYEILKHGYRTSGVKRNLPIIPYARNVLSSLVKKGFELCVITSRPKWEPVYSDTVFWLGKNNIPYSELYFSKQKMKLLERKGLENFGIIIDDDYELLRKIAKKTKGIKLFHLNGYNKNRFDKGIYRVNDWISIGKLLGI